MPPKHASPGKRSRTGCLTCRTRKLKCDERQPVCGQCSKTKRECKPSDGIVFRHHQNASMNGALTGLDEDDLGSFYAYKDTFKNDNVWLPITGPLKFIHIKDPYDDEIMLDLDRLHQPATTTTTPSHPISDVRNEPLSQSPISNGGSPSSPPRAVPRPAIDRSIRNKSISTIAPSIEISSPSSFETSRTLPSPLSPYPAGPHPASSYAQTTSFSDQNYRLPSLSHTASPVPWSLSSTKSAWSIPSYIRPPEPENAINDPEVLFLLRHFANGVGVGMDLFDCGRFFSDYVPTRALVSPLLRNAACAYAAKQLAMVKGSKLTIGGMFSPPARSEFWPNSGSVDWKKYATKYYDEAIHHLVGAVNLVNTDEHKGRSWQEGMIDAGKSDDLMAATAILCEFEAIDASGEAWQRHLNGTKSLLDIAEAGMRPLDHVEISKRRPRFSRARRAIFWNFARQDYAAALITESSARLNVNNHQLWRDAGLELDADGRLVPNKGMWIEYSDGGVAMREDMLSNALILILSKICNYLSNAESFIPPPPGVSAREMAHLSLDAPFYGLSQQMLLQRWQLLSDEVESWKKSLPQTFEPIGRSRCAYACFQEIWFGIGMCAAAIANYHMACILLLTNKPQESTQTRSTVRTRLDSYRSILPEVEWHSREICGIALARPETPVRILLILPLFFAGQCLVTYEERRTVAQLLRAIEKDLGWSTEYRVQALLREWQMTEDDIVDRDTPYCSFPRDMNGT